MAVRDFDGVDDVIKLTCPTYWGSGTPHTLVAVVKRDATSSWDGVLSIGDSLGSLPNVVLEFDDGSVGAVLEYVASNPVGTDRHSRSPSGFTSTGWELVAASVAADGSTQIRHHRFDGTTWTHANTSSTSGGDPINGPANWGTTSMELRFGNWNSSFNFFDGKIAVIGMWVGTSLSDSQVVALAGGNKAAWASAGAAHLWELNQASTATAVTDSIGSLDQTGITGTAVVTTDDPPTGLYNFGSPPLAFGASIGTGAAASTNVVTITTTTTVPAGAKIVVGFGCYRGAGATAAISGGGLTWAQDAFVTGTDDAGYKNGVFSADAPSGLASGTTITITISGGATFSLSAIGCYITGAAAAGSAVDTTGGALTTTATWSTGNLVTTNANDLIFALGLADFSNGPLSATSPAVEIGEVHNSDFAHAHAVYRIVTSTGTYTTGGSFDDTVSKTVHSVGVAYKAATSGATTVSGSDSATETDSATASVSLPGSQTATGTDTGTATATASAADTATATDAGTVVATGTTVSGAETGTGTDSATVAATLSSADTATGTDAGTVVGPTTPVSGSDSATGTDAGTLADVTPQPEAPLPAGGRELVTDETPPPPRFVAVYASDHARAREAGTVADLTPPPPPRPVYTPLRARPKPPVPVVPPPVAQPAVTESAAPPAPPVPAVTRDELERLHEAAQAATRDEFDRLYDRLAQLVATRDEQTTTQQKGRIAEVMAQQDDRLAKLTAEQKQRLAQLMADQEDWRMLQMLGLV